MIRLDPRTGKHCTIVSGMRNTSSLKFGRGPGWPADRLYVTGFDGVVREATPPAGAPQPQPHQRKRLALSVSPRQIQAGRRTRFHFTASRAGGGLRANVRIRLAGRSVRTNRRGRAGLTLLLTRPGRYVARATRRGYSPARRTVRVFGRE